MKKQSKALGKATSSILAFVLAVGLVPSGALAYAAEAAAQPPAAVSNTEDANADSDQANASQSSGATDAGENASGAQNGASDANAGSASDAVSAEGAGNSAGEGTAAADADPSASNAAASYTTTANGVISAQVPLGSGDTMATVGDIQVAGLTYRINTDDPTTVSVTGLAADKPAGNVAVQSHIANAGATYKVTNIRTGANWGGVRTFCAPWVRQF